MECLNGFSQKWFIIRTLTGINYWLPQRMGYPHELNEQKFDRTIEIGEHWWIINGARCPVRWVNGEKDWWWELPRIEWIHCLKDCYERVFSFYALLIYSQRTKRWKISCMVHYLILEYPWMKTKCHSKGNGCIASTSWKINKAPRRCEILGKARRLDQAYLH